MRRRFAELDDLDSGISEALPKSFAHWQAVRADPWPHERADIVTPANEFSRDWCD